MPDPALLIAVLALAVSLLTVVHSRTADYRARLYGAQVDAAIAVSRAAGELEGLQAGATRQRNRAREMELVDRIYVEIAAYSPVVTDQVLEAVVAYGQSMNDAEDGRPTSAARGALVLACRRMLGTEPLTAEIEKLMAARRS